MHTRTHTRVVVVVGVMQDGYQQHFVNSQINYIVLQTTYSKWDTHTGGIVYPISPISFPLSTTHSLTPEP